MDEQPSTPMNLDLNLGPIPESEIETRFDGVIEPRERIREVVRVRARQRWRWRQIPVSGEPPNFSVDLNELIEDGDNPSTLLAGEGSNNDAKSCDTNNAFLKEQTDEKKDVEKSNPNDGSVFDCNICFDLATDPVVTCCGHLYCWACLYQWLHVHSDAKECPVCKGEVNVKTLIPIYGRGSSTREIPSANMEIPVRPRARRVESLRQTIQRNPFSFPMEDVIRRIGRRFDLSRDDEPEGENAFLNRIMTLRGIRAENGGVPSREEANLRDLNAPPNGHRFHTLLLRRGQNRSSTPPTLMSAFSSAERLVDAYFGSHPPARGGHNAPPPFDDRESLSSVAAVINSENQVDAAVEIDSMVSLSSSSSRRRVNTLVSDVDSGDSRAPRRRRLV